MYDGAQVIQPECLKELDPTEIAILLNEKDTKDKKAVQMEAHQKYRDILKSAAIMEDGHTAYILLGIENQTDVNYAMPVRNMLYDALQYTKQVSEIADVHRRKKENSNHKSVSHAEFISGFYKNDRLIPVITLVIYFNANEWDGPRSLLDMMECLQFKKTVRGYLCSFLLLTRFPSQDKHILIKILVLQGVKTLPQPPCKRPGKYRAMGKNPTCRCRKRNSTLPKLRRTACPPRQSPAAGVPRSLPAPCGLIPASGTSDPP